jgi:hypothetical protein
MQRHKVTLLTINDPTHGTVRVFALDPEYRLAFMKRVEAIANANAQSVQEYRYPPAAALVAFEPKAKHEV